MSNKFAAALKPVKAPAPTSASPSVPAPVPETLPTGAAADRAPSGAGPKTGDTAPRPHARPSRQSTKHVGGYFDPAVSKQLRLIALDEDSSVQALLGEAIDMLFQSRRRPTIASKPPKG